MPGNICFHKCLKDVFLRPSIEAERREKRQNHRNAPAARDRMLMNVPSARLVHIAQARQHTNADPRQQHRQAAAEQRIQHESPVRREKIKRHSHQYVFSFTSVSMKFFQRYFRQKRRTVNRSILGLRLYRACRSSD